ncbi:MAG: B12-binding domain-containing radical SAM protein [Actinomycetia bacterium]|nr:B12-binding domain-containing radical SAM protein [Actinomycetes bacterium]
MSPREKFARDSASVVLISIDCPGYSSYATALLRESLKADPRLPELRALILSFPSGHDPWWIVWRLARLTPAPDFVCFSVYCWNSAELITTARLTRQVLPDVKIVFGGPEAGPQAADWLARYPWLDAVALAEGERVLPELVYSWARGGDPTTIPGLAARDHTGALVSAVPADPIEPLDALPCAYTDEHPPAVDGSAYLETYRGCPHACSYCFEGKGLKRIRSFSYERIAAEVERMVATPGLSSFSVIDAVFNLSTERLERLTEIFEPHARRGLRLHTIEVDLEHIDARQAELLARCGVVSVESGPQTTNQRALELVHRRFDPERWLAGLRACQAKGIAVEADLIVGLPGDRPADVRASLDFVAASGADILQVSTLRILPGTDLWARADELGLEFDTEAPHEIISTPDISYVELRQLETYGLAVQKLLRGRAPQRSSK